ncbi:hypothetical protein Pan258_46300 [Symmachiella dynata]|uniref:pilus assembly protein TadG-related protein n=1 Tax=Symmachiella dynata TaxID=2527995 RepID=UPI00118C6A5B|nr:pilus assembly protein TadG-related protein [Symmachiella dynata]QDT50551.1 hypothetical protein Pan258_46300 [Symmachiella dynata]
MRTIPTPSRDTGRCHNADGHAPNIGRSGKVIVLLAIMLPTLFGIVGLVIDGGMIMDGHRQLQHSADAAATAAARDLQLNNTAAVAVETATDLVQNGNQLPDAGVTVNIPPTSGLYAGQSDHVEVIITQNYRSRFMQILTGTADNNVQARAVAGVQDATAGAAVVVLDPDPADASYPTTAEIAAIVDNEQLIDAAIEQSGVANMLSSVPVVGGIASSLIEVQLADLLPGVVGNLLDDAIACIPETGLPTLTAGLEVEGLGRFLVDGSILVNNQWGGVDENGDPAGAAEPFPYAVSCMPLLPLTRVLARDIRVVGGVDDQDYYLPFDVNDSNPLQASRLPVPDPFANLPVPSVTSDEDNVSATIHNPADLVVVTLSNAQTQQLLDSVTGQLSILLRPLFAPLVDPLTSLLTERVIEPGVYNSITALSPLGGVRFEPGVYIIRGVNPATQISLSLIGPVQAEGVLFYITESSGYNVANGAPDAAEDPDTVPDNPLLGLMPSTLITPLIAGGRMTGLNDPGSPFHGMLIYQQRLDRRPIVIEAQQLVGSGDISGTIYAKWGHTIFVGAAGSYDLRFVTGTMRVVTVADSTLAPSSLLPAASDVFLLE